MHTLYFCVIDINTEGNGQQTFKKKSYEIYLILVTEFCRLIPKQVNVCRLPFGTYSSKLLVDRLNSLFGLQYLQGEKRKRVTSYCFWGAS